MESFHAAALDQSSYSAVQIPLDPRAALRFAVSVVYRASLSSLDHFTDVSLGTYAKIAAEIAVNSDLSGIGMPLVAINVLTSETLDMKQLITYPVRCSGGNGQYYVFVVSGIQFLVKFGGMNDRIGLDDSYTPIFRVRPDAELTVCCYPFQDSAEFEFLADPTRQRCTH